jgi:hypothetical protein
MKSDMVIGLAHVKDALEITGCGLCQSVLESGHTKGIGNHKFVDPSTQVDDQPLLDGAVCVDLES